ncbi:MAG: DPP IV N-terminal domain-containing protein [Chloroflexales bacterium]|nr:DPP IV N-terminal domain-containing protein [Chloroflexales bacterium]
MNIASFRLRTRLAIIALVALLAGANLGLALWPQFAAASFPGQNGKIVFTHTIRHGGGYGGYYTHDLSSMESDGSQIQKLLQGARRAVWSPDGRRLAFVKSREIWLMDADGRNSVNITPSALANATSSLYLAWSRTALS